MSVFFYEDITRIVADNTDVRARAQIAVQPAWAAGKTKNKKRNKNLVEPRRPDFRRIHRETKKLHEIEILAECSHFSKGFEKKV